MTLKRLRRIILFYTMLIFGLITIVTGLVLYFWPKGPRAGQLIILGFEKDFWKELHTYVTVAAVVLIVLHIFENRACVKMYVRETLKSG
jgi:cytochrome b subunit of formate dehydrogenase